MRSREKKMKLGIIVGAIMEKEFPIVNADEDLTNCVKSTAEDNACLVINQGDFAGFIDREIILQGFLEAKDKVSENELISKISIIDYYSDAAELFNLIKNERDLVIVKRHNNIVGIVAKRDLKKIGIIYSRIVGLKKQKQIIEPLENIYKLQAT